MNQSTAVSAAANANVPEAKQPAASPDSRPQTQPVKTVVDEQPPEELFDAFSLPAGKRFEWPAVKNPRVPQIVDYMDVNENPKLAYRYPETHARMATVISPGYSASRWSVENDQLLFKGKGTAYEFLLFGDPNWTDYTVEFETYIDEPGGQVPLGLLFRCAAHHHLSMFLHGVGQERKAQLLYWEPDLPNLGVLQNEAGLAIDPELEEPSSPQSWKKTSVTVRKELVAAQINNKMLFNKAAAMPALGQVGIVCKPSHSGVVRFRNIRVTAPDGRILWQGVPELPPGSDKAVTRLWPQPDFRDWTRAPQPKNGRDDWQIQDGVSGQLLQANSQGGGQLSTKPFDCGNYIFQMKIRKLRGVFDFTVMTPHSNKPTQRPGTRLHIVPARSPIDTANARPLTIQFVKAANGYVFRQNGETIYSKEGNFELPEQGQIGIALTKPASEVVIDEIVVRRLPDNFRLEELPRKDPKLPRAAPQIVIQTLPAPITPQLPVTKVEPPQAAEQLALPYQLKPSSNSIPPTKGLVLKQGEPFEWAPVDAGVNEQQSAVHYEDIQGRRLVMYRYQGASSRMATVISRAHMPGRWAIEKNELTYENSVSDSEFLLFGDPNWTDYTVEFETCVERTNAVCPVGVVFRCAEDQKLQLFQHSSQREKAELLVWRPEIPKFTPLRNIKGQPIPPGNFTVQNPGAWKKHSVTVMGDRVVAKRDKLVMFDNAAQMPEHGRVGMKFELVEDGKVHVRNIRVTSPDGTVLWEGLPELPTLLERNVYIVWPENLASHWTKVPKKVDNSGDWQVREERGRRPSLCAAGKLHPPLLFDSSDHMNYVLEVKIRKLRGEFDLVLNVPKLTEEPETTGTRLHLSYASQPPGAAGLPMFLQLSRAVDGFQLRVNDETIIQHRRPSQGFELTYYGFDLTQPDSEIEIEEINIRRVPHEFRLYDEQFQARPKPKQRGEKGWELVVAPPGTPKPPPVAAVNPAPAMPAPGKEPPRNPLADIAAKLNLDAAAAKKMPAAENPDLLPRLTPLATLARNDEELQKILVDLEKTRAAYKEKVKKYDDDYLKAFETEIARIRTSPRSTPSKERNCWNHCCKTKKILKRANVTH